MANIQVQILLICCIAMVLIYWYTKNKNNINNNNTSQFGEEETADLMMINEEMFSISDHFDQYNNNNSSTDHSTDQRNMLIRFKNLRLKYRVELSNACPENTKLIMLSMARRDGFDKRKGVRQTWMNDSVPGEVIRFFIADVDVSRGEANDTQKKLEEEQAEHGDLVFLHGFEDKYKHIHLKWYAALQWQQAFCKNAEWVMKTDDDAVVHLRRLSYWMDAKFRHIVAQHSLAYIGLVLYHPTPIRDKNSKWHISEDVYPLDWYPDFMQGTVYLTTPATIGAVLARAKEIVGFYLDDVLFTGILAELAKVHLSDHKKHFIRDFFLNQYGKCENGMPTAISMYGIKELKGYAYEYQRLKSYKC